MCFTWNACNKEYRETRGRGNLLDNCWTVGLYYAFDCLLLQYTAMLYAFPVFPHQYTCIAGCKNLKNMSVGTLSCTLRLWAPLCCLHITPLIDSSVDPLLSTLCFIPDGAERAGISQTHWRNVNMKQQLETRFHSGINYWPTEFIS